MLVLRHPSRRKLVLDYALCLCILRLVSRLPFRRYLALDSTPPPLAETAALEAEEEPEVYSFTFQR